MTHTVEGYAPLIGLRCSLFMWHLFFRTSGIGDHGPKGLQDFVNSHGCNYICNQLHLASSRVLQDTLDDLLLGGANGAEGAQLDDEGDPEVSQ